MNENLKKKFIGIYLYLAYKFRDLVVNFLVNVFFKQNVDPHRIVVHRIGEFGDSIVALPALRAIRLAFPSARLDVVSTKSVSISLADIAYKPAIADEIYVFKKGEKKQAWEFIKNRKYDLYIEIPQNLNLIKTIISILRVRFLFGITTAFGWDKGRIKRFLRYQKKYMKPVREVDRFLFNLKKNDIVGEEVYPLNIAEQDREFAKQWVKSPEKSIAFIIGGKYQAKKWPIESWIELASQLISENDIYLIGGKTEIEEANQIANSIQGIKNMCGKTSLMQTAAILEKMRIAVSHDTGAMHLCYAVGAPVIALFSARELSDKWFPPKGKSKVLEKIVECSFCFKNECEDNICMKKIKTKEILKDVNEWK